MRAATQVHGAKVIADLLRLPVPPRGRPPAGARVEHASPERQPLL
jgi:hypothetical protein